MNQTLSQLYACIRFNAHHIDLNRNFPDYFEGNAEEVEVETSAVMKWLDEHQFVISAGLHGGALVANYPYDNYPGGVSITINCVQQNRVVTHLNLEDRLNNGLLVCIQQASCSIMNTRSACLPMTMSSSIWH
jgi:hypothetical protein